MWWILPAVLLAVAIGAASDGSSSRRTQPTPQSSKPKPPEPQWWELPNPEPPIPSPVRGPSRWRAVIQALVWFVVLGVAFLGAIRLALLSDVPLPPLVTRTLGVLIMLASLAVYCTAGAFWERWKVTQRVHAFNEQQWQQYKEHCETWEQAEAGRRHAELERKRRWEEDRARSRALAVVATPVVMEPVQPKTEPVDPTFPDDCRALNRQILEHAAEDQRSAVRPDDPQRDAKLATIDRTHQDQMAILGRSDVQVDDRVALEGLRLRHEAGEIPQDLEVQVFAYRKDLEFKRVAHVAGVVADPLYREDERAALRKRVRRLEAFHYQQLGRLVELEHQVHRLPETPAGDALSNSPLEPGLPGTLTPEWQTRWEQYSRALSGEAEFRALAHEKIEEAVAHYAATLPTDDPFRDSNIGVRRQDLLERLEEFVSDHYRSKLEKEETRVESTVPTRKGE